MEPIRVRLATGNKQGKKGKIVAFVGLSEDASYYVAAGVVWDDGSISHEAVNDVVAIGATNYTIPAKREEVTL